MIYTALSSGIRQAELLGLGWPDLDPDIMLSISVSRVLSKRRRVCEFREPKTSHSRRYVSMTPELATLLREYRQECKALYRELGKELTLDDLVFASAEGKALNPPSLSRDFATVVKRVGLENVRFHDLGHTFASLMLLRGAKPNVTTEALGPASVGFTLDVYSHIIEGMQSEAMALLDEVLPAAKHSVLERMNVNLTSNPHIMSSIN